MFDIEDSIIRMSASEIVENIHSGKLSATEVLEAYIKRIEEINGELNAVVVPLFKEAREAAEEADRKFKEGISLGPLHGLPVTIKEQFDVKGTETHVGVPAHSGPQSIAASDGPLVARLRESGAIILGKTNVMMTLAGWESDNPVYGRTNNPWNKDRTPGGSSGGEAAIIAAYGSPLGLGGDFGGSVRIPSHFCGLHSLKPTSGRLTNADTPARLFSSGNESVIPQPGPMARYVKDLKMAMKVLCENPITDTPDLVAPVAWRDPDDVVLSGLTVAKFTDNGIFPASPVLKRMVEEASAALSDQGVKVIDFTPPNLMEIFLTYFKIQAAAGKESIPRTLGTSKPNYLVEDFVKGLSIPAPIRGLVVWQMQRNGQGNLSKVVDALRSCSAEEYWRIIERKNTLRYEYLKTVNENSIDAFICPSYATVAPPHGLTKELTPFAGSFSIVYNMLGVPAGVVSIGSVQDDDEFTVIDASADASVKAMSRIEENSVGLPVSVQVVGKYWREDVVLRIMEALEASFIDKSTYPRFS